MKFLYWNDLFFLFVCPIRGDLQETFYQRLFLFVQVAQILIIFTILLLNRCWNKIFGRHQLHFSLDHDGRFLSAHIISRPVIVGVTTYFEVTSSDRRTTLLRLYQQIFLMCILYVFPSNRVHLFQYFLVFTDPDYTFRT